MTVPAITSGVDSNAPIGPHSQVQNTNPTNTRTGLSASRRPTMLGVMKWPSSVASPTKNAGATSACPSEGNTTSPATNSAIVMISGPT
jgi:hypothetical protein